MAMKFNLILGLFVLGTFAAPEKSRSEIFNEHQKKFDDVGKSLSDYGFGMIKNADGKYYINDSKVHIFWEGQKILQNLHRRFVLQQYPEIRSP